MPSNKPAGLPCPNSSASFWHSEPHQDLLGHRTTDHLPKNADIVIVGSGITGASIIRYLAADPRAASMSIIMLEAREVCWGATGRNGGHCQPLLFDRSPEVAAFEMKNVAAVRSYIEENNVSCAWRSVTGCRLFGTMQSFDDARAKVQSLAKVDPELGAKVTFVEPGDVKTMKKHRVNPNAKGLTLTEGAGQLWPYKYVTSIIWKLVSEKKFNLQTNTPVTQIVATSQPEYPQSVHTLRGQIGARHVILATNGYTSHLLHGFTDLIVPIRCEMSSLHPPAGSDRLPNSYGMVAFGGSNPNHDDYLVQLPFYDSPNGDGTQVGGHLMFGGGRSLAMYNTVGESDDDIVDPGEADYLRRALLEMLDLGGKVEGLKELKASHQWTGIKGYSRDNMPWVGKVPSSTTNNSFENGLWLCGGYTGHGMPNATLCGKAVVDMVLAEQSGHGTYESFCEELVSRGDLPHSYVITEARLKAAHNLTSVVEQDSALPDYAVEKSGCHIM